MPVRYIYRTGTAGKLQHGRTYVYTHSVRTDALFALSAWDTLYPQNILVRYTAPVQLEKCNTDVYTYADSD